MVSPINFTDKLVNIESLSSDIKQLIVQQKATQRALDTGDLADKKLLHPKDRIRHVLEGYLPQAVKKTNFLSTLLEDMDTSFTNCLIYYCEEPKDPMARSQFFQKFDFFIKDYKRVKKENFDMEEESHRAEMRRKAILKAGQKNILDQAMNQSPNHAVMDNLLEKLRVGPDPEARRTRKRNLPARRVSPSKAIASGDVGRSSTNESGAKIVATTPDSAETKVARDDATVQLDSATTPTLNLTVPPVAGNSLLAARAQSMLAGLRSGKVVHRASTDLKSPDSTTTSPMRLGFSKTATQLEEQDATETGRDSPTPTTIERVTAKALKKLDETDESTVVSNEEDNSGTPVEQRHNSAA